jgi:HEAT repeat protein
VIADDPAAVASLSRLATDTQHSNELRREAVHWLGLLGNATTVPMLVKLARDNESYGEKKGLSSAATYALALLDDDAGVNPLIDLSRDSSPALRKATVFPLAETDNPRAFRRLKEMLDDRHESNDLRKDALFWLGQRETSSTADIVSFYRNNDESSLREQAIFVLSQRQDEASVDALMKIARDDGDRRMRGKALFWLAQKNDPRVTKLISDILR